MYMPILKWKRGEQAALANLGPADKISTLPVIELLVLPDADQAPDDQGRGPFHAIVQQILRAWGTTTPIAVDMEDADGTTLHPIDVLFAAGRGVGLQLVPVTGPARSPDYQAAIARAVGSDHRGVVLRLSPDDLFDASMPANVQQVLTQLGVAPPDVDFLCDLGFIGGQNAPMLVTAVRGVLANIPVLATWRHLIVAASNLPSDFSTIHGLGSVPRTEWALWNALRGAARSPSFGDYAVAHPIYTQVPFAGAANIRYTIASDWLIFRGFKVTMPGGFAQFVTMSQQLVLSPSFCGPGFSWGDGQIALYAGGASGTGNMTTWRAIATNHHIVFVLRQLAAQQVVGRGSPVGVSPVLAGPSAQS